MFLSRAVGSSASVSRRKVCRIFDGALLRGGSKFIIKSKLVRTTSRTDIICRRPRNHPFTTVSRQPLDEKECNNHSFVSNVSTSENPSTIAVSSIDERWDSMTRRLLGYGYDRNIKNPYSLGMLSDAAWAEAKLVLQYWMEQGNISMCWKILDRLHDELGTSGTTVIKQKTNSYFSTQDILNPILKLWKDDLQQRFDGEKAKVATDQCQCPSEHDNPFLWPSQVAERIQLYQQSRLASPDKASYCIILSTPTYIQQRIPTTEGIEFADDYFRAWVHGFLQQQKHGKHDTRPAGTVPSYPKPDSVALGTVIHAWAESGHPEGPVRAEQWLRDPMIQKLDILNSRDDAQILYTTIMTAWAHIGNVFKTVEWMKRILEEGQQPDTRARAALIRAWATYATLPNQKTTAEDSIHVYPKGKRDRIEAAEHAHMKLMEVMELETQLNESTYNIILEMWSKLADIFFVEFRDDVASRQAAERANSLLLRMKKFPEYETGAVRPGPASYHAVLSAHCRSRQPWLAEQLLDDLFLEESNQGGISILEGRYFSTVIWGWSLVDERHDVGERGDKLLTKAREFGFTPDSSMFCAAINCWAKAAGSGNFILKRKAIERSEELISEMKEQGVKWNSFAVSEVLKVYANCNKLEKAQTLIIAWLSEYEATQDPNLQLSPVVFTPLLSAWARSNDPSAAVNALKLLRTMQKHGVNPNDFSYAAVINAFASSKSKDAADTALELFHEMQLDAGIEPSTHSWTNVIKALAAHDRVNEAEELLERMISGKGARPNAFTFNAVLQGLSMSRSNGAAARAMEWLERMQRLYDEQVVTEPPNQYCYNSTMTCMARSNQPGMAIKVEAIMNSMLSKDHIHAPDRITIHAVMNAWANEGNWAKVLSYYQVLLQHQNQSSRRNGPNHVTLGILWKAVEKAAHLSADDKVHTMGRLERDFAEFGIHLNRRMQETLNRYRKDQVEKK